MADPRIQTTYCWSMDYVVSVLADHRSRLLQRADVSGSVSSELLEKLVRRKDSGEAIRMLFNEAIPDRSRPLRDALYSYIRADESLAMMLLQRDEVEAHVLDHKVAWTPFRPPYAFAQDLDVEQLCRGDLGRLLRNVRQHRLALARDPGIRACISSNLICDLLSDIDYDQAAERLIKVACAPSSVDLRLAMLAFMRRDAALKEDLTDTAAATAVVSPLAGAPSPGEECNGFIVQLLDQAGIPHLLWGDYLTSLYSVPQIISTCGFIVPDKDFDRACLVLSAFLRRCLCETLEHCSDPAWPYNFPAHFTVPGTADRNPLTYICPASVLHDLLPVTWDHPNPLGLDVIMYPIKRDDARRSLAPARILTLPSLAKAVLALVLVSKVKKEHRRGLSFSYGVTLGYVAVASDIEGVDVGGTPWDSLWMDETGSSRLAKEVRESLLADALAQVGLA